MEQPQPRTATAERTVDDTIDALSLNRRHALVFTLCGAGLFFESLNLQIMSFVAPMIAREWRLGPSQTGLMISAAIFGMMAGTYIFGAAADRMGRRLAFQVTVGLFSVMTALSGFSMSLGQLLAARCVAGIGIGGSIPVETAVLAEFTPVRWRGRVMALWATALPIGALVAPLCVAAIPSEWGWRALLFLGGAPALLVLFVRRLVPETPAYLAAKGRLVEAARSLSWISNNDVAAIATTATSPQIVAANAGPGPERALFGAALRRSTAIAWTLNFGSFFAYYGFVLWLPALLGGFRGLSQSQILPFMFALAIAGLVGRLATLLLADRFRRESLILGCSALAAAALSGFAFQTALVPMMLWGCAAALFLEGTFSAAIPFVAELYPARFRATGIGWAGGMGRLGTALAPLAVGAIVQIDDRVAVLLLASGSLLACLAALAAARSRLPRSMGATGHLRAP